MEKKIDLLTTDEMAKLYYRLSTPPVSDENEILKRYEALRNSEETAGEITSEQRIEFKNFLTKCQFIQEIQTVNKPVTMLITNIGKAYCYMRPHFVPEAGCFIDIPYWDAIRVIVHIITKGLNHQCK